jgi:hypothetical protein
MPEPIPTTPQVDVSSEAAPHPIVIIGFWQKPWVQQWIPFITSLLFHLGVVLLVVLLVKVGEPFFVDQTKEQMIFAEASLVQSGPQGGIPHPGLGGDPTRDAAQDLFPEVPKDSRGLSEKTGTSLQAALIGGSAGQDNEPASVPIGAGIPTLGKGKGATGADDIGSANLAPFGVPGGGGGLGAKSNFIGVSGGGRRIAWVCDASGSMLPMFDALRDEIQRSISNLKPVPAYNVIFFREDGFDAADKTQLMMATPSNKQRTYEFIAGVSTRPNSNPVPALDAALKQGPDVIYLLTDGEFPDPEAVLRILRLRNADKRVKVYTLAFVPAQMLDSADKLGWTQTLKQIAQENGGAYRHFSDADIGLK